MSDRFFLLILKSRVGQDTSYTVTSTDANGCTVIDSAIITEPSAIDTTVTRNNFTLMANQTGASYQWLDCNNAPIPTATMQSYTVMSNGNYTVEITSNGCVDTSTCNSILNVGVNEQRVGKLSLNLYPNPNKGLFTVELDENAIGETIQIMNLSGSLITTIRVNSKQQQINLSHLSNGVYLVRYENSVKKNIISK